MSIYGRPRPLGAYEFNAWRARYESMPYDEHVRFHSSVWRDYPKQQHYDLAAAEEFFEEVALNIGLISVLEIGGWTGDVAKHIMARMPIWYWNNIEICREAVEHGLKAMNYSSLVLHDWIWNQPDAWFDGFGVVFASHSFEHITEENIRTLLPKLQARWLYVDAPLEETSQDWSNYIGAHILKWSWPELEQELAQHGWEKFGERSTARMFKRC